jgi:hypothetical protein
MYRRLVTRTQYLAELNNRLRGHAAYVEGMQFVSQRGPEPETSAGFDWVPPNTDTMRATAFAEVAAEVHALYRMLDL